MALLVLAAGMAAAPSRPVLYGYDVVAYRSLDATVNGTRGVASHAHSMETFDFTAAPPKSLGNYTFWFATDANRATFEKDPWKYAPRWGGF